MHFAQRWTADPAEETASCPPADVMGHRLNGDRGLQAVGHPPLMVRPPGVTGVVAPPELEVATVTDAAGLVRFERTIVGAYPRPEWMGLPDGAGVRSGDARLRPAAPRHWVWSTAFRSPPPAPCTPPASTWSSGSAAGPSSRQGVRRGGHRGAATAVPEEPALMLASDDGRPAYERMGLLAVDRWTLWTRLER